MTLGLRHGLPWGNNYSSLPRICLSAHNHEVVGRDNLYKEVHVATKLIRDPVNLYYPLFVCGLVLGLAVPLSCGISFGIGLSVISGSLLVLASLAAAVYGTYKLFI